MNIGATDLGTIVIRDIQELSVDAIKQVASLHSGVMHALLTDLGDKTVWAFYQLAHTDSESVGYAALTPKGRVIGWVMGSRNPAELNSKVRASIPGFMWRLATRICIRPILAWRLIRLILCSSRQNTLAPNEIELTYIGVSPDARGRGIGSSLIKAFLNASASRGYQRVFLSVESDNHSAITLYANHDFRIAETFQEGPYHRHRMVCDVARNPSENANRTSFLFEKKE